MKRLSLLLLLAMSCCLANAKDALDGLTTSFAPARYGGNYDVDHVCFFSAISGAYVGTQQSGNSISRKGKGLGLMVDMGAKIPVGHSSTANNILSISFTYILYGTRGSYRDASNVSHDFNYGFTGGGLPVSFTSIHDGRGAVGFYWQAGIIPAYIGDVADGDTKYSKDFNPISISPFLGAGIAVGNEITRGPYAGRVKALIGPFVSYCATNMSALGGVTMRNYMIGLQITTIRLGR